MSQDEEITVRFKIKSNKVMEFFDLLRELDGGEPTKNDLTPSQLWAQIVVGYRADDTLQRRDALQKFVDHMEIKLRKNDHKTDWRDLPIEGLFRKLLIEVEEFKVADEFYPVIDGQDELVDIANFAMILHNRRSTLDQGKSRREQTHQNTAVST